MNVRFRAMEEAVLSANELKNTNTQIITVGVGAINKASVKDAGLLNLQAISDEDHAFIGDWEDLGKQLAGIANDLTCQGSITIKKDTEPASGPAGTDVAGWTFNAANTAASGGSPISPTAGNSDKTTNSASWSYQFNNKTATTDVTITEKKTTQQQNAGWSMTDVTCTGGTATGVNYGTGTFTVTGIKSGSNVVCTVTNSQAKGTLKIEKRDADTNALVSGATFKVTPNPATGTGNVTITEGTGGDAADGTYTFANALAGTYTVEETAAPPGFLLPPTADRTKTTTVSSGQTATLTFNDPKPWSDLQIDKTVVAKYDASYAWSITKKVKDDEGNWVDQVSKSVAASGATGQGSFDYKVELTQGDQTRDNYRLSGVVTVTNPNGAGRTMRATLSDATDVGACAFPGVADKDLATPGLQVDVAPGANNYSYTCVVTGTPTSGQNAATVTWSKAAYPKDQNDVNAANPGNGTASVTKAFAFVEDASTNKTVTLTDDKLTGPPTSGPALPAIITWSSAGTKTEVLYSRTLTANAGTCTDWDTNTAAVKSGQAVLDSDTAKAKLCVGADLAVTKNVIGKITKSYLWKIDKKVCPEGVDPAVCLFTPTFTVGEDGTVTVPYQVTATPNGSQEIGWVMSGEITVSNPNDFADVTLTQVSDVFSGGGTCVVDTSGGLSVPKKAGSVVGSKTYPYTCTFTSQPSHVGTNTASVEWDSAFASPAHSASKGVSVTEADWTVDDTHAVNKTINVYDDKTDPENPVLLGQADWDNGPQTFPYNLTLEGEPGKCVPVKNTAYLAQSADGDQLDSDEVDVTVCAPGKLSVTKRVDAKFDRAYQWSLVKKIKDAEGNWVDSATKNVDAYSAAFDYKVTLEQKAPVDSNYRMSGTITVSNPNSASVGAITTDVDEVPNLGGDATAVCTTSDDEPFPLEDVSVPAGESVEIDYTCTITGTPGANPVNQVPATSTLGGVSEDVTFTIGEETDKQVSVYDDKTDPANPVLLGTKTYGGAGAPSWDFEYSTTVRTDGTECEAFINTAKVFGDDEDTALGTDTATATLCPNEGEWVAHKTSDPISGSTVVPGQTITYTLNAEKTGGADPKDVVIYDNLTDVLDHASFETSQEDLAAQGLVKTGNTLTWTIPTLGATPKTASYTVKVNSDAWNVTLKNAVTRGDGGECEPADCTTTHVTPSYSLTKVSVPPTGSTVVPGDEVEYTLTVKNTSTNGAVLDSFAVKDDLSGVMDHVEETEPTVGTVPGNTETGYDDTADAETLTWSTESGEKLGLAAGDSVTLSYTVTVAEGAWNVTLKNVATPEDNTGGECEEPGDCTTTHVTPSYSLTKVSVPPTGSTVVPGDEVEYTLTVKNTSTNGAVLDSFAVKDDLSGVMDHVEETEPTVGTVPGNTETGYDDTADAETLTWSTESGEKLGLAAGDSVTLSYTVTVAEGAWNVTLKNVATPVDNTGGECVEGECGTTHLTPHYRLAKTSDYDGQTVQPGTVVTYELTVTNDSDNGAVLSAFDVVDNMAAVVTSTSAPTAITPSAGSATYDAAARAITWTGAGLVLAPEESVTLTYQVTINADAWNRTIHNVATPKPGTGGECVAAEQPQIARASAQAEATLCETTSYTPPQVSPPMPPVVNPPVVKPPKVKPPKGLPNTGGPASLWLYGGVGLVLLGGVLLLSRRRRGER